MQVNLVLHSLSNCCISDRALSSYKVLSTCELLLTLEVSAETEQNGFVFVIFL